MPAFSLPVSSLPLTRFPAARCALALAIVVVGCAGPGRDVTWLSDATLEHYRNREMSLSRPVDGPTVSPRKGWKRPPRTIAAPTEDVIRDLGLAEALKLALENNPVIRSRGGFLSPGNAILSSPDRVASIWDPAIQETGVLFGGRGVTAALAAFDPEFTTTMIWGRNETPQNNSFLSGGVGSGQALVGETGNFTSMLRKQLGYGASLSVGHDWSYFGSNTPSAFNLYNSTYTGNVRVGYRQPLLAGSGTEFTRIAGPVTQQFRGLSGVSQGVLIARINNDLTMTQFEQAALNLVKDVEDLYWDLYLAYRKWDAAVTARNSAQKSWRDTKVILDGGGKQGFTNSDEPLARDRFFQSRAQAEAALSELYRAETALRRMLGLPVSDGTVLRPSDELVTARFEPNWEANLVEALTQRVELRRQRWSIRSMELQHKAARSLIRPRLDMVGGYRINALGDDLFSNDRGSPFPSGYRGLSHADHTGWNLGVEFTVPLGMRSANAQVKNLELRLAKARAVLDAQEMEISHELSDAVQQMAAHEAAARSNFNRRAAAQERVRQFEIEVFNAGTKTLDDLLRAQVSRSEAEVAYYTSLVAYNQALTNLHFRTGRLLAVNNVQLAESEWTPAAYRDALRRAWERSHGLEADGLLEARPPPFAESGSVDQIEAPPRSTESGSPAPSDSTQFDLSTESEPVEPPKVIPATHHEPIDRTRKTPRQSDDQSETKPVVADRETTTEPIAPKPAPAESKPRSFRVPATVQNLADRFRGTKRELSERFVPKFSIPKISIPKFGTPKPATPQPETGKPETPQPETPQPETPQPVTPQPVTPHPVTPHPVTSRPATPQPETARPVTSEPVTPKSVTTKPPKTSRPSSRSSRMPAGYQGFLDRIRKTKQRLGDRFNSRLGDAGEETPVEPVTPEPRSSGPSSRSERMPGAYHDLVDRIRKAKQRFESRSNPTPGASYQSPAGEGGSGNRQSQRPVVPVSREKLARQIWQSKQRGENRADTASEKSKPRTLAGDSSGEPVPKPGAVDESFRLPKSDGSDHEESVRRGLVDPEWPLPR